MIMIKQQNKNNASYDSMNVNPSNSLVVTWRPAKYMKDLSEKWTRNTRKRVETGMSKKKGTNDANIRPYGPEVTRFLAGSAIEK